MSENQNEVPLVAPANTPEAPVENRSEPVECDCGMVVSKRNLSTHRKSKHHIATITQLSSQSKGGGGDAVKRFLTTLDQKVNKLDEKLDTVIGLLLEEYSDEEAEEPQEKK